MKKSTGMKQFILVYKDFLKKGISHEDIKKQLSQCQDNVEYYAMSDVINLYEDKNGELKNHYLQTMAFVLFKSPLTGEEMKELFPDIYLYILLGLLDFAENRSLIKGTLKSDMRFNLPDYYIANSFEECWLD